MNLKPYDYRAGLMNIGSLHTRSFRRLHLSVLNYKLIKNGFSGPKVPDSQATGPRTRVGAQANRPRTRVRTPPSTRVRTLARTRVSTRPRTRVRSGPDPALQPGIKPELESGFELGLYYFYYFCLLHVAQTKKIKGNRM